MKFEESERTLTMLAYPIGFLLIALPLIEVTLTVWPPRFGGVMWRYGSYGLLSQALMLPTLGFFLTVVAAQLLEHRRMLRVLSVMALLAVLLFVGGMAMFIMDGLQARTVAAPEMRPMVVATAIRATGAMLIYIAIWSTLAVTSHRLAGRQRQSAPSSARGGALIGATQQ